MKYLLSKKILTILCALFFAFSIKAQIKLSALPSAGSLNDADAFYLVQSATSKQVPWSLLKSTLSGTYLPLAGGTMSGNIDMNGNDLLGVDDIVTNYISIGGIGIYYTSGDYTLNFRGSSYIASRLALLDPDGTLYGSLYALGTDFGLTYSGAFKIYYEGANDRARILDDLFVDSTLVVGLNAYKTTAAVPDSEYVTLGYTDNKFFYNADTANGWVRFYNKKNVKVDSVKIKVDWADILLKPSNLDTNKTDDILDSDFSSNGLMERTGAGTYAVRAIENTTIANGATDIPTENAVYDWVIGLGYLTAETDPFYIADTSSIAYKDQNESISSQWTFANNVLQSGNKFLRHSSYVGGINGAAWQMNYDGTSSELEVDNLVVRNTLRTHIFQKDVVRATNGHVYISDSGVLTSVSGSFVYFDNEKSATFTSGDTLWVKDFNEANSLISVKFTVGAGTDLIDSTRYTATAILGSLASLERGMTAVRVSGNRIYMTASDSDLNIDLLSGNAIKTRIGDLTGITFDGTPLTGYGLYTDNGYFEGKVIAASGDIGGWTIGATSLTSTNIGLHSGASAQILLGHATTYASAKIGLKNDGSGKLASGNLSWDASGNISAAGSWTNSGTITGGTIQSGSSGQRIVLNGATNQLQFHDGTGAVGNFVGSDGDVYFDGDFRAEKLLVGNGVDYVAIDFDLTTETVWNIQPDFGITTNNVVFDNEIVHSSNSATVDVEGKSVVRLEPTTVHDLTTLSNGVNGQILIIYHGSGVGADDVTVKSTGNINLNSSLGNFVMNSGDVLILYDSSDLGQYVEISRSDN